MASKQNIRQNIASNHIYRFLIPFNTAVNATDMPVYFKNPFKMRVKVGLPRVLDNVGVPRVRDGDHTMTRV